MALRLYINGTEGAQDGELISNGDMSNPITFDGYDIETGDVSYAQFAKAYLRADPGEEWVGVCLKVADVSGSEDLHDVMLVGRRAKDSPDTGQIEKVILSDYASYFLEQETYGIAKSNLANHQGAYTLLFPYVGDTNSEDSALYLSPLLYLGLKDPNTTIKIIMTAGAKNE